MQIQEVIESLLSMMSCTISYDETYSEEIKNIDPLDFETYQDYVDAYICSSDIKYLQVRISHVSNMKSNENINGGSGGIKIIASSWL